MKQRASETVLLAVLCVCFYTELRRYEGPIGEKYVDPVLQPGGADFASPYTAANAFIHGVNPYINDDPSYQDPFGVHRVPISHEVVYQFNYSPSAFLVFVPLVLLTGGDFRVGAHVWFFVNLAMFALLAWVLQRLLERVVPKTAQPTAMLQWLFFLITLAFNPGSQLLLERGQIDVLTSLLVWSSLLLYFRRLYRSAFSLGILSFLIKPYAIVAVGLMCLHALYHRRWRSLCSAVTVTCLCFVLPAAKYWSVALASMRDRAHSFVPIFSNHSFRNLFFTFSPDHAAIAAYAVSTTLGACILFYAWSLRTDGGHTSEKKKILIFYLSLLLMCTLSASSVAYNLVHLIPGMCLFQLILMASPSESPRWLMFANAFALVLVLLNKIHSNQFPVSSLGLLLSLALTARGLYGRPITAVANDGTTQAF